MFIMRVTSHGITFGVIAAAGLMFSGAADGQVPAPPAPGGAAPAALPAPNAQNQNGQNGMQVLDQGPIHEAFAEGVALDPAQGVVVNREPPEPINEVPPEVRADGENIEWIPGYWMWSDEQQDFIWISGVWRDVPPGRRWVPGHWTAADGAFQWVSGFWAGAQLHEVQMLPDPPETLEIGPSSPAPGANYFWVPGCWTWNNSAYGWRAGYWYAGQANWVWIPDRYCYTPQGVVFVNGYWDYPIARRGLLFAPVYWSQPVWGAPGWSYRPYSVVDTGLLLSALFFNRHHHHYYYGHGNWRHHDHFRPWWDNGGRGRGYDPFCAYHRWHDGRNRDDWANSHRQNFNRYQQDFNRPGGRPRSTQLVSRVDLAQRQQIGGTKLRTASSLDLQRSREQIDQFRNIREARVTAENRFKEIGGGKIAVGGPNGGSNDRDAVRDRDIVGVGRDRIPGTPGDRPTGNREPGARGTRPVDAGKLAGSVDRDVIRSGGGRRIDNDGPTGSTRAAFKLPPVERSGSNPQLGGNRPDGNTTARPRFSTTGPESFERRTGGDSTPGIIRSDNGPSGRPTLGTSQRPGRDADATAGRGDLLRRPTLPGTGGASGSGTTPPRDIIRGGGQSLTREGRSEQFRENDSFPGNDSARSSAAARANAADAMRRQMGSGTSPFQQRGPTSDGQLRSRSSFPQSPSRTLTPQPRTMAPQPRSLTPQGGGQLRSMQAPERSRPSSTPRMSPSGGGPSSFRGAPSGGTRSMRVPSGGATEMRSFRGPSGGGGNPGGGAVMRSRGDGGSPARSGGGGPSSGQRGRGRN